MHSSLWIGLLLVVAGSWLAFARRWLSAGGALAAAAVGAAVCWGGGWPGLAALLWFFATGTLLGKLPVRVATPIPKHHTPRDSWQVLANGGVPALLFIMYVVWPYPPLVWAAYACLSAAAADTWSSSIGQWRAGATYNPITWRPMAAGVSGGVSLKGTLAGVAGASTMAVLAGAWGSVPPRVAASLAGLGVAGGYVDSLLGWLLQAKYKGPNGQWADEPPAGSAPRPQRGYACINNDMVNLLSLLITALAAIVVYSKSSL